MSAATSDRTDEENEQLARLFRARRAAASADARLSLPTPTRLLLATSTSFLLGMALGVSHGSSAAGLRFRAENAHRLPATPTGWYLYHKTKNYNMALGGVREGVRMGARMSVWVAAFFAVEDAWDEIRGRRDAGNTVIASLSVAGAFSLWNRFPLVTAARTARTGLIIGLGYGLAQDAVRKLRGHTSNTAESLEEVQESKAI